MRTKTCYAGCREDGDASAEGRKGAEWRGLGAESGRRREKKGRAGGREEGGPSAHELRKAPTNTLLTNLGQNMTRSTSHTQSVIAPERPVVPFSSRARS